MMKFWSKWVGVTPLPAGGPPSKGGDASTARPFDAFRFFSPIPSLEASTDSPGPCDSSTAALAGKEQREEDC